MGNGIFSIQFQGIVERDISAIRREAEAEELRADLNKLKVGAKKNVYINVFFFRTKGFLRKKRFHRQHIYRIYLKFLSHVRPKTYGVFGACLASTLI